MPETQVKDKLVTVEELGAAYNAGVKGIKGDAETDGYRHGNVVLSPADIGALPDTTTAADIGALPSTTTAADIGAVSKAGDTMTGNLILNPESANDRSILFGSIPVGYIQYDANRRFRFLQRNPDGQKYDRFNFPITGTDASNQDYYILTDKSPVTVAQGGTGATTTAAARTNLGITPANIGAVSTSAVIDVAHGGTGANTAGSTTLSNLGLMRLQIKATFSNGEYTYDFGSTQAYVIGYNAVTSTHQIIMRTTVYKKTYVFTDITNPTNNGDITLEIYYMLV